MICSIIRKIIISESENTFINEITSKEAQEKFYGDVGSDLFKIIVNLDPTYNQEKDIMGQYTKWLLNKKNLPIIKQMKGEDYYKVTEDLRKFDKLKKTKKIKGDAADINKYDINTLADFMFGFGEDDVVSNTEKEKNIKQDVEKYSVGEWDIIVPKTEEASCYYGKGTRWCTAADYDNMFNTYNNDGKLWIIINKKDPSNKYQFHFESGQYMNPLDREIDLDGFFDYNEELRDFFLSEGYEKEIYIECWREMDYVDFTDETPEEQKRIISVIDEKHISHRYGFVDEWHKLVESFDLDIVIDYIEGVYGLSNLAIDFLNEDTEYFIYFIRQIKHKNNDDVLLMNIIDLSESISKLLKNKSGFKTTQGFTIKYLGLTIDDNKKIKAHINVTDKNRNSKDGYVNVSRLTDYINNYQIFDTLNEKSKR